MTLGVLVIFLPIMLINLRNLMQTPAASPRGGGWLSGVYASARVLYVILVALFGYTIVRILFRINRLRKTKDRARS